jgi:RHS repeat-associated protein
MEIVNGKEITYLFAQGQPFAIHKKNVNETNCINYLHLDYQGSLMAITSQGGNIIEERNYDVWGRPRNPNTLEYVLPNPFGSGSLVKRGFTFHEHLEEFNLINMNGRMYDPLLARFLNADPLLQDNTDAQNFNRYSYVLNNPTKYTDPSGYAFQGAGNYTGNGSEINNPFSWQSYNNDEFNKSYKEDIALEFGSTETNGGGNGGPIKPKKSGTIAVQDNLTKLDFSLSIDAPVLKEQQRIGYMLSISEINPFTGKPTHINAGLQPAPFSPLDIFSLGYAFTGIFVKGAVTLSAKYVLSKAVLNPNMTVKELAAGILYPRVASMMFGKGVDRSFRQLASRNLILNPAERLGLIKINPSNKGADMIGKGMLKGQWWDITTPLQWNKHVVKYGPLGTPLLYKP